MTLQISHLVGGLIGILILVGAAFSFGMQWSGKEDGTEAAAAASVLDDSNATTTEEAEGDPEPELYSVIKIVDGDTIAISMNGKNETLRLIGIDTPETVDTRVEVQCFGKESSEKMKALLGGQKVRLEMDAKEGERDKYKRLLAYVFREDGLFVNEHMIEQGFAYEYTYDSAYKYQKEFKAAEVAAKSAKMGLWASDACPTPEVKGNTVTTKKEASPPPEAQPEPEPKQEEPEPEPAPSGEYTCSSNKYNCGNFKTHAEAQAVFDQCGGADNDVHKLDNNKDGEACESLP